MGRIGLLVAAVAGLTAQPCAADSHLDHVLRRLEPDSRFNQICDIAAMSAIAKDVPRMKPDRAMLDAGGPVKRDGNTATGSGAVFRSGGRWFGFSFVCEATPDRMRVTAFDYRLLGEIPRDKWDDMGLWR